MLTDEQRMKAEVALLPNMEDLEKMLAYERHEKAVGSMDRYGLPYRVYLDYLKRWDDMGIYERGNTVKINRMYPLCGYPIDKIPTFTLDDLRQETQVDERGYSKYLPFAWETLSDDAQVKATTATEPLLPWHPFDEKWRYYFLHFLTGYQFDTFTEFDFYGTQGEHEKGDISLLQKTFARWQREYAENPKAYMQEEPTTTPAEKAKYTDRPYNVLWDKNTLIERERLTNQMGIKPTFTDAEKAVVYGTDAD